MSKRPIASCASFATKMDFIGVIKSVAVSVSWHVDAESTAQLNSANILRAKLNASSHSLLLSYEEYTASLVSLVRKEYPDTTSETLFVSASKIPAEKPLAPWKLQYSSPKQWTLFHELVVCYTNLSVLYCQIGLDKLQKECYDAEILSETEATLDKWKILGENYLKKAVSVCQYTLEHAGHVDQSQNSVFETSLEYLGFVEGYLRCNLQLCLVVMRSFWQERVLMKEKNYSSGDWSLLEYQIADLDKEFYDKAWVHLLVKIATYLHCQLDTLIVNANRFKSNDESEDSFDWHRPKSRSGLVKSLRAYQAYIDLYLAKYFALQAYIKNQQVGKAISFIEYGFSVVDTISKTAKIKSKFVKPRGVAASSVIEPSKLDSVYKKYLSPLAMSDFHSLAVNMNNLLYQFRLQNDNLAFEKVEKVEKDEFVRLMGLGREVPVNIVEFDPLAGGSGNGSSDSGANGGYY